MMVCAGCGREQRILVCQTCGNMNTPIRTSKAAAQEVRLRYDEAMQHVPQSTHRTKNIWEELEEIFPTQR